MDIWHVEEAPADPDARAGAHEQHASDAETDFGSVNVVYSTSPQERNRTSGRAGFLLDEESTRQLRAHPRTGYRRDTGQRGNELILKP
ncbi:hypothetical protein AB0N26_32470 [Streptomyces cellulosae]